MSGLRRLLAALLRDGRVRLLVWPAVFVGLYAATAASIVDLYEDPASRASYAMAYDAVPVMTAIGGAGIGLEHLGAIIANEAAVLLIPGLGIVAVMLAVRASRGEEDTGRSELVTALPLGRLAPAMAGMLTVLASLVLTSAGILVSAVAVGVPAVGMEEGLEGPASGGALAYALATLALGMFFAGIGFLTAELAENSRTATLIGIGTFAVAWFLRVALNASGHGVADGEAGWAWTTPVGWFDLVAPFGVMRWWAVALLAGSGVGLGLISLAIRARRDLGSGVIPARPGPASAGAPLRGPSGLVWYLNRVPLAAWCTGTAMFGVLMGSQLDAWVEILRTTPEFTDLLGTDASADAITQLTVLFIAFLASAAGISSVGQWTKEESAGRLAAVLAHPVCRAGLWVRVVTAAVLTTVLVLGAGTAVYMISGLVGTGSDDGLVRGAVEAAGTYLVPSLLLVSVAAAWVAGRAGSPWPAWIIFGWAATVSMLGASLQLPDWAMDTGLFHVVGAVPTEDPNVVALLVEGGAAVLLVGVSVFVVSRRELRH